MVGVRGVDAAVSAVHTGAFFRRAIYSQEIAFLPRSNCIFIFALSHSREIRPDLLRIDRTYLPFTVQFTNRAFAFFPLETRNKDRRDTRTDDFPRVRHVGTRVAF